MYQGLKPPERFYSAYTRVSLLNIVLVMAAMLVNCCGDRANAMIPVMLLVMDGVEVS